MQLNKLRNKSPYQIRHQPDSLYEHPASKTWLMAASANKTAAERKETKHTELNLTWKQDALGSTAGISTRPQKSLSQQHGG